MNNTRTLLQVFTVKYIVFAVLMCICTFIVDEADERVAAAVLAVAGGVTALMCYTKARAVC